MTDKIIQDIVIFGAKVIFIMESPHVVELKTGIPLSGKSGAIFSKELLNDSKICAGEKIIKEKIEYSIINTFQNALKLSDKLKDLNSKIEGDLTITEIKNIYLKSNIANSLICNYKIRIINAINNADDNVKIVVCGKNAQAYFEFAFDNMYIDFGTISKRKIDGKKYNILYVSHPSPMNIMSPWSSNDFRNEQFKSFVML